MNNNPKTKEKTLEESSAKIGLSTFLNKPKFPMLLIGLIFLSVGSAAAIDSASTASFQVALSALTVIGGVIVLYLILRTSPTSPGLVASDEPS